MYFENVSTADFSIEILRPAEITIDTSLKSLLFIPGFPGPDSHFDIRINNNNTEHAPRYIPAFLSQTCRKAAGMIAGGPRFNTFIPEEDMVFVPSSLHNWEDIDSLCLITGVDILAILKYAQVDIIADSRLSSGSTHYSIDDYSSTNIEGSDVTLLSLTSKIKLGWHFFIPNKRLYFLKETTFNQNQENIQLPDQQSIRLYLENSFSIISDQISQESSERIAQIISPYWETSVRKYFNKGCRNMRRASFLIDEGRIDEAADLWTELFRSNRPGIAKHALFNLLLIYELSGDYAEGLKLAENLEKEYHMQEAISYKEIFEERIREKEMLDRQLP